MADDIKGRKEALRARLDQFLSKQLGDGYGWPNVNDGVMTELHEIVDEIIALKFRVDCDGDQVIDYVISSRKEGRLIHDTIPHLPETKAPKKVWDEWAEASISAGRYLIASGLEAIDVVQRIGHRRKG